jgi:AGCS family alanine or glycine:cation symporter
LVVIWLILGGIFFTIRFKFINIRGFKEAVLLVSGRKDKINTEGEVSHFQALTTALSATVGLGNIAGVAVAISIGGPGATFWMILAGFLGMSLKFTECTLGVKYRNIDKAGTVSGGPMYYLRNIFSNTSFSFIGKLMAFLYAALIIITSFGIGNMFQSNQAYSQLQSLFPVVGEFRILVGLVIAILVGLVIVGGIRSIARVTSKIVPFMAILYVTTALIIIVVNISNIGLAFREIWYGAFSLNSATGGILGALIVGFQRGAFSNEAGVGSASIAHSAVRTHEPVTEGLVGLLEPFIDTVVICTMTALVIIFSGLYENVQHLEGAPLTSAAFATVFPWFPYVLLIAILLFAISTMISWSYYGLKGFNYLLQSFLGKKISTYTFNIMFCAFIVIGAATELTDVIAFADMMILVLAFPNILGLIYYAKDVNDDLNNYMAKYGS